MRVLGFVFWICAWNALGVVEVHYTSTAPAVITIECGGNPINVCGTGVVYLPSFEVPGALDLTGFSVSWPVTAGIVSVGEDPMGAFWVYFHPPAVSAERLNWELVWVSAGSVLGLAFGFLSLMGLAVRRGLFPASRWGGDS